MNCTVVSDEAVAGAVAALRQGGLVAYPTETYYGLAADPFNDLALERLFAVKHRPQAKPVLVLIAEVGEVNMLAAEVPAAMQRLMKRFWPGPLTLVLPARPGLSRLLTGGTGTIGIRRSPHPVADRLVRTFGSPLTATSANLSGAPPAVTAGEVAGFFGDRLDMVLDGGTTPGRLGSTLVGMRNGKPECLRQGWIPFAEIRSFLAEGTTPC